MFGGKYVFYTFSAVLKLFFFFFFEILAKMFVSTQTRHQRAVLHQPLRHSGGRCLHLLLVRSRRLASLLIYVVDYTFIRDREWH